MPVCWRLTLVCCVMSGSALGLRLFTLWRMRHVSHNMQSAFPLNNGTHFFMDVGLTGSVSGLAFSRTRHLEDNGWRGVCANPFPDAERSCVAVSMPVAPVTGQQVKVSDCSASVPTFQAVFTTAASKMDCPQVERTGVSISELLQLSKAPRVIDYLALSTQGSELEILKRFPFESFCVRAWTIDRKHEEVELSSGIRNLLVSRRCRVKDISGSAWFARCPCPRSTQSLLDSHAAAANKDKPSMKIAKKAARKHKGTSVVISPLSGEVLGSPGLLRRD